MPSARHQRGAVTLIGALFIVLVIGLLVQVLNRMAGSAITATVAQNDSVEALFVAESGLEFASFVYANGTVACADLATTINTTVAGRGSFDITSSFLAGTDCRVTVQGRVSSVGAVAPDTALRTVSADLRLASGEGWAVGDNGSILRWDGASWSAVASSTTENLYGVHCVSANDCWAAGSGGTILHWNGSAWLATASGTTGTLQAISCAPLTPGHCFANGATPIFLGLFLLATSRYWDGVNWTSGGANFALDINDYYSDIACPSSTCFSTTGGGRIRQSSTSWGNAFNNTIPLNGIDCAASAQCWAVGDLSGNNYYFVRNNGGSWSVQTVPAANNVRSNLNAVSCSAVDDCWAAGDVGSGRYVLVHWNGTSWSSFGFQNGQHRDNLNGIHCASASDCWAVGDQQNGWNLIHYDGASWSHVGSSAASPTNLNDVYLPSTGTAVSLWFAGRKLSTIDSHNDISDACDCAVRKESACSYLNPRRTTPS